MATTNSVKLYLLWAYHSLDIHNQQQDSMVVAEHLKNCLKPSLVFKAQFSSRLFNQWNTLDTLDKRQFSLPSFSLTLPVNLSLERQVLYSPYDSKLCHSQAMIHIKIEHNSHLIEIDKIYQLYQGVIRSACRRR